MNNRTFSYWLVPTLLVIWGSVAVGSGVVRLTAMTEAMSTGMIPAEPEGLKSYIEHPFLSAMHLLLGSVFLLLTPFQFVPAIRRRWPVVHRGIGRVCIVSGFFVGLSAIAMSMLFPVIVNSMTTVANAVFSIALMACLVIAFCGILRGDIAAHRAWMIRAYAIALSVATMRLVFMGIYFLLGTFQEAYLPGLVWAVFILHVVTAEIIICYSRRRRPSKSSSAGFTADILKMQNVE